MDIRLPIVKIRPGAKLPEYAHGPEEDAGVDLTYCGEEQVVLAPGARQLLPTGIVIQLPERYEAQIRPRSGLALRKGITVLNSPGTVDPGYRGEIGVLLVNLSSEPQSIEPGERIAQLVVAEYATVALVEVESLSESGRSSGGFGSTGP